MHIGSCNISFHFLPQHDQVGLCMNIDSHTKIPTQTEAKCPEILITGHARDVQDAWQNAGKYCKNPTAQGAWLRSSQIWIVLTLPL